MADLMDQILSLVRAKTSVLSSSVSYDAFSDDTDDELMVRHDTAPAVTKRYMTGKHWAAFNFSFYAKSLDGEIARDQLERIQGVLFIDNFCDSLGLSKGRMTVLTRPHFIGKDDRGARIFTSSYGLVFFVEGS